MADGQRDRPIGHAGHRHRHLHDHGAGRRRRPWHSHSTVSAPSWAIAACPPRRFRRIDDLGERAAGGERRPPRRCGSRLFALADGNGAPIGGGSGGTPSGDGIVHGPAGQVALADLHGPARASPSIEEAADAKMDDEAKKYARHAFGAQFAEVRIDPDLRTIKVSRWVGAFDCRP